MSRRVALYARVSTRNGHQDPETQLIALREVDRRVSASPRGRQLSDGVVGEAERSSAIPNFSPYPVGIVACAPVSHPLADAGSAADEVSRIIADAARHTPEIMWQGSGYRRDPVVGI